MTVCSGSAPSASVAVSVISLEPPVGIPGNGQLIVIHFDGDESSATCHYDVCVSSYDGPVGELVAFCILEEIVEIRNRVAGIGRSERIARKCFRYRRCGIDSSMFSVRSADSPRRSVAITVPLPRDCDRACHAS